MRIVAEDSSPVVRLDDGGFAAVLAAARGEAEPDPEVAEVLARPELVGPLTAATEPLVTLSLTIASADLRQEHRGWLTYDDGLLLLAVRDSVRQLLPVPPAMLAVTLARLVRIGPRKVGDRTSRPLGGDLQGQLFDRDAGVRARALQEAGNRYAWSLVVSWAGGERRLVATDGESGLCIVDDDRLVPVSPTFGYRLLTTVLPGDAQVAA